MSDSLYAAVARLAATQHGVFSRMQALRLGATDSVIHGNLRAGRWLSQFPGVYAVAGVPKTWRQSLMIATLAAGSSSLVSHGAAAALLRLNGFEPCPAEVLVPRPATRRPSGLIVHESRDLIPQDHGSAHAIPVTSVARTLLDLAGCMPFDVVEDALDDALRRELVRASYLRWRLERAAREGRAGVQALRRMLDERRDRTPEEKNIFERNLRRAIQRAGLPEPVAQHRVRDGGRVIAIPDFAYPDVLLAIEADGYAWHSGRSRWRNDLARRSALARLGWRVIHVTWEDLHYREIEKMKEIADALAA